MPLRPKTANEKSERCENRGCGCRYTDARQKSTNTTTTLPNSQDGYNTNTIVAMVKRTNAQKKSPYLPQAHSERSHFLSSQVYRQRIFFYLENTRTHAVCSRIQTSFYRVLVQRDEK